MNVPPQVASHCGKGFPLFHILPPGYAVFKTVRIFLIFVSFLYEECKIPPASKQGELHYQESRGLHQLDDCHLSSIAAAFAGTGHSGVAAVAVSVLGSDLLEQLMSHILFGDE